MIETSATTPILPPRPNLGPEPLSEPLSLLALLGLAMIALAVLGIFAWWLGIRRRNARGKRRPVTPPDNVGQPVHAPVTESQSHELVLLAQQCRGALVARFGDRWAAKTTEELGEEPGLPQQLGPERVGELLWLLREADRIKFAEVAEDLEASEPWRAWVSQFVAEVRGRVQAAPPSP